MPESVKNEDLATAVPENPSRAYDQKCGTYKSTPIPVHDTAVTATPLVESSSPWKNLKGG